MVSKIERRVVFAKFVHKEILGEWGRLLFSLLDAFASSGYEVQFFDNIERDALGKYGPLIFSLKNFALTDAAPTDTAQMIYLFDGEDKAIGRRVWRKKVQVKFDVFSPYWFSDPIIMPYPLHPVHMGPDLPDRLKAYRRLAKRMRILFAGDTAGYVKNRIHYPKSKLVRVEAMEAIRRQMADSLALVDDETGLDTLLAGHAYSNRFVLGRSDNFRVSERRWLSVLAGSDFFLCLPGYVMPMCHNTVEAMAVGTIPIINYPEWFSPRLEHLNNCIVFDDGSDLIAKLNDVLRMRESEIAAIRQRVIEYYESHLTQASFVHKIESSRRRDVVVLLITDANVNARASKLNKRSVLIRGTPPSGDRHWVERLWQAVNG